MFSVFMVQVFIICDINRRSFQSCLPVKLFIVAVFVYLTGIIQLERLLKCLLFMLCTKTTKLGCTQFDKSNYNSYIKYLHDWIRFTAMKDRRFLILLVTMRISWRFYGKLHICVSCVTCRWLATVAYWHIIMHFRHQLSFNLKGNKKIE